MDLFGRRHSVTVVNGPDERAALTDVIPDLAPNDLVIGVQAGHAYAMYEGVRYDGSVTGPLSVIIGNAQIRRTKMQPSGGVLIRLTRLPSSAIARLDQMFAKPRRTWCLTCATGVGTVVDRLGTEDMSSMPTMTPNLLLRRLLSPTEISIDGQVIGREIVFYNLTSLDRQRTFDRLNTMAYGIPIGLVGLVALFHFL